MATYREHIENIDASSAQSARNTGYIAQSQAAQTQLLGGIAFSSGASAVFNGITAANTARQAHAQQQQLALQQEQHALQTQMAERTATHEFSLWRQTPEGQVFLEWQSRATELIALLKRRDNVWNSAWQTAISRGNAQVLREEHERFLARPARLKQRGLLIGGIVAGVLAVLALIGLLFQWGLSALASAAGADSFSLVGPVLWFVLCVGATIALFVLRGVQRQKVRADTTVDDEARAREQHFGFDPLQTRGPRGSWHKEAKFSRYADELERQMLDGPSQRPMPSQLMGLIVPEPLDRSDRLPQEANTVLAEFSKINAMLQGDA